MCLSQLGKSFSEIITDKKINNITNSESLDEIEPKTARNADKINKIVKNILFFKEINLPKTPNIIIVDKLIRLR